MRFIISPARESAKRAGWFSRAAYFALLVAGIAALGYAAYALFDLHEYQATETARFEVASAPSLPSRPMVRAIAHGAIIGEIEVPRLRLKAIVVQGESPDVLRRAVGHLPETALPGEAGNVALAAHRDGLFRPLRNVLPGDAITLRTESGAFQYEVEWTAVVAPTVVSVIQPTNEKELTLVTCFPFYYVGSAPERFVVRARQIEQANGETKSENLHEARGY